MKPLQKREKREKEIEEVRKSEIVGQAARNEAGFRSAGLYFVH